MTQFRKKPVVIDAVRWTGDSACLDGTPLAENHVGGMIERTDRAIEIRTLEGKMLCRVGDWIIRGVKGELYPCRPDIFDATYEPVDARAAVPEGNAHVR
jgi:hypothetical protein